MDNGRRGGGTRGDWKDRDGRMGVKMDEVGEPIMTTS